MKDRSNDPFWNSEAHPSSEAGERIRRVVRQALQEALDEQAGAVSVGAVRKERSAEQRLVGFVLAAEDRLCELVVKERWEAVAVQREEEVTRCKEEYARLSEGYQQLMAEAAAKLEELLRL